ncbi:hypothetical protein [Undibacterium sp.]|uniref:hypothetical protein n=1 Tax=Undibacterium sp. TaxID=1914977 RepID=UPI00374CCCDF
MEFLGIGTLLFIVPFGIALLLPGWRSIAGVAIVGIGLLALLLMAISQGDGNSFGKAVIMLFVLFAAGGLAAGMVLRAIVLALRGKKKP